MKAIAVIEKMPKDCDECPLVSSINDMCILLDEDAFPNRWVEDAPYYSLKEKGDCPLRPLPQKKIPHFDPNACTYDEERERSIMNEIDGYNRCIDEILGEK